METNKECKIVSRTANYVGLNARGRACVAELEAVKYGLFEGAFFSYFPLFAYVRPDTNEVVYIEFIQEAPWASGPHYFIALIGIFGNKILESLWTTEEIDAQT